MRKLRKVELYRGITRRVKSENTWYRLPLNYPVRTNLDIGDYFSLKLQWNKAKKDYDKVVDNIIRSQSFKDYDKYKVIATSNKIKLLNCEKIPLEGIKKIGNCDHKKL